ncbi:hypothetical protein FTW19_19915 [Terriglobus albidus]|uniref:Uncharacterized protein n=1 Tax=Terriglobus albidus TaxID=1592106 RepID=A0A5B9EIV4_9BACT|nr:hypothetical protein [Terriglobus albidus]QEE30046.1 hypothetical protein FTW19_19915 [Terriglobus albidus]
MHRVRTIVGTVAVVLALVFSCVSARCEALCDLGQVKASGTAGSDRSTQTQVVSKAQASEMGDMPDCGAMHMTESQSDAGCYIVSSGHHLCGHDDAAIAESTRDWQPNWTVIAVVVAIVTAQPVLQASHTSLSTEEPPPGPLTAFELTSIQRV